MRFLDASWHLDKSRSPQEEFLKEHIKGAARFDIDAVADPKSTLPHMSVRQSVTETRIWIGSEEVSLLFIFKTPITTTLHTRTQAADGGGLLGGGERPGAGEQRQHRGVHHGAVLFGGALLVDLPGLWPRQGGRLGYVCRDGVDAPHGFIDPINPSTNRVPPSINQPARCTS